MVRKTILIMNKGCGKHMYNIAFKNGKIISIKADKMSWDVQDRTVSFLNRERRAISLQCSM